MTSVHPGRRDTFPTGRVRQRNLRHDFERQHHRRSGLRLRLGAQAGETMTIELESGRTSQYFQSHRARSPRGAVLSGRRRFAVRREICGEPMVNTSGFTSWATPRDSGKTANRSWERTGSPAKSSRSTIDTQPSNLSATDKKAMEAEEERNNDNKRIINSEVATPIKVLNSALISSFGRGTLIRSRTTKTN